MVMVPCARCGEAVEARTRRRQYCDSCRTEVLRATSRNAARSNYRSQASSKDLTCESCDKTWRSRSNRGRWCPDCRTARQRAQQREWRKKPENRERMAEAQRNGRSADNAGRRAWLKSRYGITLEEYEHLYEAQDGRCAICSKWCSVLCVDHCHDSKEVRGLLCSPCNRAIGQLGDTADSVQLAVDYLRKKEA